MRLGSALRRSDRGMRKLLCLYVTEIPPKKRWADARPRKAPGMAPRKTPLGWALATSMLQQSSVERLPTTVERWSLLSIPAAP